MKQSPESSDGDKATDQSVDQRIDGSSSALAERLLRRATEPVGMIDSSHPRNLHARVSGWLAQRFGLLDHWRTRYAVEDSRADGESLIFKSAATRSFGETAGGLTDAAPIARAASSPASPLKVSDAGSNDAASSTTLLRVSRRAAHPMRQVRPQGVAIIQAKAAGHGERQETASSSENKTTTSSKPSPARSQNISGEPHVAEIIPAQVLSSPPLIMREVEDGSVTAKSASPVTHQLLSERTTITGSLQPSSLRQRLEAMRPMRQVRPQGVAIIQTKAAGHGERQETASSSGDRTTTSSEPSPLRSQNISGEPRVAEITPAQVLSAPPLMMREVEDGSVTAKSASPVARQLLSEHTTNAGSSQPSPLRQQLETISRDREPPPPAARTAGRTPLPVAGQTSAQRGGTGAEIARANDVAAPQRKAEASSGSVSGAMTEDANPLAPTPLTLRSIQRQPAEIHISRKISVEADSTNKARSLVAKEVGAVPAQTANAQIIWRKDTSDETGPTVSGISAATPLPLKRASSPNLPVIARQPESRSVSTISSSLSINETDMTASLAERNVEVDLPRLAEQVSRILARQLAVERERRGMNR